MSDMSFGKLLKLTETLSNEKVNALLGWLEGLLEERNWVRRNLSTRIANELNSNYIYTEQEFSDTFTRPGGAKFNNLGKASMKEINNYFNQKEG